MTLKDIGRGEIFGERQGCPWESTAVCSLGAINFFGLKQFWSGVEKGNRRKIILQKET